MGRPAKGPNMWPGSGSAGSVAGSWVLQILMATRIRTYGAPYESRKTTLSKITIRKSVTDWNVRWKVIQ